MIILEVRDIFKSYSDEKQVLKGVSFSVSKGEFLSVLGSSGCGKTTLLRILIGLLKPDCGSILKNGVDITEFPPDKRSMGMVFQNYALFENMTVLGNVEYALKIRRDMRPIARKTAEGMLDVVGLSGFKEAMPASLSGGQQQRVAIARTLCLKPDIILLDEPMSALDVSMRISLRKELKKIQKEFGTTMIYVTHDQEEAFALSDRIMVMDKGRISQIDTPENICDHPANDYVKTFVLDNLREKIVLLSRFANYE